MAKTAQEDNRELLNISIKKFIGEYEYRIDLDADYQREKIWSQKMQQLLLDSILRDIDIPKIYIVEVKGNKQFDYECIDGKQRMTTLLRFFRPESNEETPLTVRHYEKEYTYKKFKKEYPTDAKTIEDYELSFAIYKSLDDEFVREIFRRLQLGIRLNSGELLKTRTGTIRDFIYKEIGNKGPFFRYTNLSEKRFSRPFTLAQICINSFAKAKPNGEFVRARLQDIEDFFEDNHDIDRNDENLVRVREVLKLLDSAFKKNAKRISSRAVAVTAYLYAEELYKEKRAAHMRQFAKFYLKLLDEIKHDMDRIRRYEKPSNPKVLEEFQRYVTQASVEAYSIKRRHEFVKKAFEYYLKPKTKGQIIGSK
ncbi:MAG: DUF262 domain-containing protein [Desulfobacteraceae bacterium]|nr:DUF262 domain-containing protein [Desulfobacteraceae bacterium]